MPERPPENRPGPRRHAVLSRRVFRVAAGLCLCALLGGWAPVAGASLSGGPAPMPSSGATADDGGDSLTTTSVAVLGPTDGSDGATDSQRASTLVQRVVIALFVLAAIVIGASVVFWRRTNPDRVAGNEAVRASQRVANTSNEVGSDPLAGP